MKNRIRELRSYKGVTQTQLASDAGISRQYLSDLEKGNSEPSITIALALAKQLDSTVEYIFLNNLSYKAYKDDKEGI